MVTNAVFVHFAQNWLSKVHFLYTSDHDCSDLLVRNAVGRNAVVRNAVVRNAVVRNAVVRNAVGRNAVGRKGGHHNNLLPVISLQAQ